MTNDMGNSTAHLRSDVQTGMREQAFWRPIWVISRYQDADAYNADRAYLTTCIEGNALLNSGINEMWRLIAGDSSNAFNAANAQIGVGDSTAAVDPSQTDLQATTNVAYQGMEDGYPQAGTDQRAIFRSVFEGGNANYAWREFVVKNSASGICLNRLVSDQGTKASGQIWTITLQITLS